MPAQAIPFLTFQPGHSAAKAMTVYTALFTDGQLISIRHRPPGTSGEGTDELGEFVVAGQRCRCSDSLIEHAWGFTPAASMSVDSESTDEQQRVYDAAPGQSGAHMPLDEYGSGPFGWVDDRFGVSWQLSTPSA